MKKTIPAAIALLAAFHSPPEARAQSIGPSTLDAAGGSAVVGGSTHEWAVGQIMDMSTYISTSLVVTPGVLQPAPTPEGIAEAGPMQGVEIFPNPVSTDLFVAPAFGKRGALEMQLLDAAGRVVRRQNTELTNGNERQAVPMESLAAGSYLLRLVWTPEGGAAAVGAYTVQKLR